MAHRVAPFFHAGLALGGAWGLREGSTRKLALPSARLRLNSILNSITRRGSFMGNSAGVLGLSAGSLCTSLRVLNSSSPSSFNLQCY
jgi:import inner membrane translocase subunit TIM23